ncbi:HD domain-containing phosphohydrolase [Synechococcus elongatus]|uniref:HD domain-containing phosphohydrolase n=1 Tax=Synechococcus elongatus TaxID=32046 RepID=UPI0030CF9A57
MAPADDVEPTLIPDLAAVGAATTLLERLLAIGIALSACQDPDQLLDLILQSSRDLTCSDGGSLYLVDRSDPQQPCLRFQIFQSDSLPSSIEAPPPLPLDRHSLAGYVATTGETLNLADVYALDGQQPFQFNASFDQRFNYRTCSMLVLPMLDQTGSVIGVLQLINRKRQAGLKLTAAIASEQTQPYSPDEETLLRSLAGQAAIAIERTLLQRSIENLFEGFIRAAIKIIESRDPCTMGHSERVARLAVRLAEQVHTTDQGTLAIYQFSSAQLQELHYASLLHDFGKVGVPEAILNKAQKLHPIEQQGLHYRLQLLQQQLQLEQARRWLAPTLTEAMQRAGLEHPADCAWCQQLGSEADLETTIARLQRAGSLLQDLNQPQILATPAYRDCLAEVEAELQWLASLQVTDWDGQVRSLLTPAEQEKLLIPKGSLTEQERRAIESHVQHTFAFLQEIPWTGPLAQVPHIAHAHHERLDGSGYPLGLEQAQIPMQAQIMAVADVYDALTASDRPYKRRVPIEKALQILEWEARDRKLNDQLVQLFQQQQTFQVLGHRLQHEESSLIG